MCVCVEVMGLACVSKLSLLVKHSWDRHTYQKENYMTSVAESGSHQSKLGLNKLLTSIICILPKHWSQPGLELTPIAGYMLTHVQKKLIAFFFFLFYCCEGRVHFLKTGWRPRDQFIMAISHELLIHGCG